MIDLDAVWPEWHIEELIGQGSYGKVYRIARESLGYVSYAAAKIISIPQSEAEIAALASLGMDNLSIRAYLEETARGIVNEIAVMDSLKGARNIVAIEDYSLIERDGDIGWTIWIRMELLQSLMDYQKQCGPPNVDETVRLGIDICNALICCEERGVIHRDIKPENIFRSAFGDYKLGDFGISRQIENSTKTVYSKKGTEPYMAPEVVRGQKYSSNVDIYSLGIMLYRYLNNMRFPFLPPAPQPFTAYDMERALSRRLKGDELPAPSEANDALAAIVLKACHADPAKRYQSARELHADLVSLREGSRTADWYGQGIDNREKFEGQGQQGLNSQDTQQVIDKGESSHEDVVREKTSVITEEVERLSQDNQSEHEVASNAIKRFHKIPVFVYPIALIVIGILVAIALHSMSASEINGSEYVGKWYVPTDTDRYIVLSSNGDVSYGDDNHGTMASGKWVVIDEDAGAIKFTLRVQAGNERMFEEGTDEFTRMAYAESGEKMTVQLYYSANEWETYIKHQ